MVDLWTVGLLRAYPYISLIQLFAPGLLAEPSPVKFQACMQHSLSCKDLQRDAPFQRGSARSPSLQTIGVYCREAREAKSTDLGIVSDFPREVIPQRRHCLHVLSVHDIGRPHLQPHGISHLENLASHILTARTFRVRPSASDRTLPDAYICSGSLHALQEDLQGAWALERRGCQRMGKSKNSSGLPQEIYPVCLSPVRSRQPVIAWFHVRDMPLSQRIVDPCHDLEMVRRVRLACMP